MITDSVWLPDLNCLQWRSPILYGSDSVWLPIWTACSDGHRFWWLPTTKARFLLLPSRLGKDRKGDTQFWFCQNYPSWLVSLLIPISADRVDLLFCNANGISDQIVTGYLLARWTCRIYPDSAGDVGWWGNCSTHLMVVGWIGLQSLWLGLTTRCSWDESVQLGLLLLSLTVTVVSLFNKSLFYVSKPALGTACS